MESKGTIAAGLGDVIKDKSPEELKSYVRVTIQAGRYRITGRYFSDGSEYVIRTDKRRPVAIFCMKPYKKYVNGDKVAITVATHHDDANTPVLADQMHALLIASELGMLPTEMCEDVEKAKTLFMEWTKEAHEEMEQRKREFQEARKNDRPKAEKEARERAEALFYREAGITKEMAELAMEEVEKEKKEPVNTKRYDPATFDVDAFDKEYEESAVFPMGDQTNLVVSASDVTWLSQFFDRVARLPEMKIAQQAKVEPEKYC